MTIADSEQYTKKSKRKLAQIEKAGYNEAQYTSGSWEALQAASKDAKAVMEKQMQEHRIMPKLVRNWKRL